MKQFLVGIGAVIALTIGLFQGPQVDSSERVLAMSVTGGVGSGCSYKGYSAANPCSVYPNCTAGSFQLATSGGTTHKNTGNAANGNCTGNAQCTTPRTPTLTTAGCGEGGG